MSMRQARPGTKTGAAEITGRRSTTSVASAANRRHLCRFPGCANEVSQARREWRKCTCVMHASTFESVYALNPQVWTRQERRADEIAKGGDRPCE